MFLESPEFLESVWQPFAPSGTTVALIYPQSLRIVTPNPLEAHYAEKFQGGQQNSKNKNKKGRQLTEKCQRAEDAAFVNIEGLKMSKHNKKTEIFKGSEVQGAHLAYGFCGI